MGELVEPSVSKGKADAGEDGAIGGEAASASAQEKPKAHSPPVYEPLGGEDYVPLFYNNAFQKRKFNFTRRNENEDEETLQAQPGYNRTAGDHPRTAFGGYQGAEFGYQRRFNDLHAQSAFTKAGAQRAPGSTQSGASQQAAWGFPDGEMERRMRRMEGMIERLSDIQRVQVRNDYFKSMQEKDERAERHETTATAEVIKDSSSDSKSEMGEWTERDGQDLWRSTKERKKRNPFEHGSYIRKGDTVSSYEKLMVVTFKTLEQLIELGKDVKGLVRHGLAMSEKAAAGVYKVETFIRYDETVRERAGQHGPSTFGQVNQEDVMRFFCYDNVDSKKGAKASATGTKKPKNERICLRFNSEIGCGFKNCSFSHRCIACEESGHAKKDCGVLKKKDKK